MESRPTPKHIICPKNILPLEKLRADPVLCLLASLTCEHGQRNPRSQAGPLLSPRLSPVPHHTDTFARPASEIAGVKTLWPFGGHYLVVGRLLGEDLGSPITFGGSRVCTSNTEVSLLHRT
jgi:hypothetical protein